jgi:hypothetical protein
MQILSRIIIVPKFKADGTVNEFANVAAVTKAALQAKFDAADPDDRFYPVTILKNVVDVRAESIYQEFTDKTKIRIDVGKRNFVGYIVNQGSKLLQKLKSWECQEFGVYGIDKKSNFVFITDLSTGLKVSPIGVDANSYEAVLEKATDTVAEMIKISFDFAQNMDDALLRYIAAEDLDFDGLNTADVYALYTAIGVASNITTTAARMKITTDYGLPVKNLIITDFVAYNVTDSASVTISTFAESSDGVYDITFAAQTSADVLKLTPTKARYDFAGVSSVAILIP